MAETQVASIEDLLAALARDYEDGATIWFRGHERSDWPLIPTIARDPSRVHAEMTLIKNFQQSALPFSPHKPASEWDWLFLMQHYGAPTRLLDWSESPLVGMYFAAQSNPLHDNADGCLWCLLPHKLNDLANITPDIPNDMPACDVDDVLDPYKPSTIASERISRRKPVAVIARRQFPRLAAQLGVFTITHRDQEDLATIGNQSHIRRYIVPASAKPCVRKQLTLLRVTRLTLFPELESVGRLTGELAL